MNDVHELARMVRDNADERLDAWQDGRLEEWLSWLDASGCVLACLKSQDDPTLLGFLVARTLSDIDKRFQSYRIDKKGEYLYVDLAIAPTTQVLRALGIAAIHRFGNRKYIVSEKKGKMHLHDFNTIRKALLRAK